MTVKLDQIPDSLYVAIVSLALVIAYALAPSDGVLQLLTMAVGGLLGLAKNRMSGGTSVIQTGANAQTTAPQETKQ